MSTTAPEGTPAPTGRNGFSIGRAFSRMRTVLRKARDSSKRTSMNPTAPPATAAEPVVISTASQSTPAPATTTAPTIEPAQASTSNAAAAAGPSPTRIPKAQLYEERARKLAERYGLDIRPADWHTAAEGDALRVEKAIRMRVRRYCHVCEHAFGPPRECPHCKHDRCRECPRYPPKLDAEQREDARRRKAELVQRQREDAPIIVDTRPLYGHPVPEPVLRRPGRPGGQDHVYRKPRQRVRRTCHECGTLFSTGSRACGSCNHVRCTDCPRDPPKRDKYPYGYPGDEFGPSAVPHYTCHECHASFQPDPPVDADCSKCGHQKCPSCLREVPRRIEPEPDPEIWERLQARLRDLQVS